MIGDGLGMFALIKLLSRADGEGFELSWAVCRMAAVTKLESIPPDKKMPSGTSATRAA